MKTMLTDLIKIKKGIYLAAYKAYHPYYNIVYQDINGKRDIGGDMMNIDLSEYDFIIATPPCNYWSKARGNKLSIYAASTKHLLPDILNKLKNFNKPYIVENVWNKKRFLENGIFPCYDHYYYHVGRHIYFSNIKLDFNNIIQYQDYKHGGKRISKYNKGNDQGGINVHAAIEIFLKSI